MERLLDNILYKVANTPLIRLNYLCDEYGFPVYGKIESFNPSMSVKDRIVKYIIEKAEISGDLKPGMTIVDATSGNTGLSIALLALVKGYRCILTIKDNSASSKIKQLQLFGARVIKCPAGVRPDDPLSYYSVAKKIVSENEGTFFLDQNHNMDHFDAHFHGTGKEIWEQTEGKISHFFASASTGGTVSGSGTFLKSKNNSIKVICADGKGSVLKPWHEDKHFLKELKKDTPLEGVGKDIIPSVFKPESIDECIEVNNEDSIENSMELLRNEGIFVGGSGGAALDAFKQYMKRNIKIKPSLVVIFFPDHGLKYIDKLYQIDEEPENARDLYKTKTKN